MDANTERLSAQVTAGHREKVALERRISELYKVPNMETFDDTMAANRMFKSEGVQLRVSCNLLSAQARASARFLMPRKDKFESHSFQLAPFTNAA